MPFGVKPPQIVWQYSKDWNWLIKNSLVPEHSDDFSWTTPMSRGFDFFRSHKLPSRLMDHLFAQYGVAKDHRPEDIVLWSSLVRRMFQRTSLFLALLFSFHHFVKVVERILLRRTSWLSLLMLGLIFLSFLPSQFLLMFHSRTQWTLLLIVSGRQLLMLLILVWLFILVVSGRVTRLTVGEGDEFLLRCLLSIY